MVVHRFREARRWADALWIGGIGGADSLDLHSDFSPTRSLTLTVTSHLSRNTRFSARTLRPSSRIKRPRRLLVRRRMKAKGIPYLDKIGRASCRERVEG